MYVVAIGPFENRELEALRSAAQECDLDLAAFDRPAEAAMQMSSLGEAPSGFFAARLRTISALSAWVRESPNLLNVPIVALIDRPSEGQFRDAFAAGADDALVGDDERSLRQRLKSLRSIPAPRTTPDHGMALVAMADGPLRRWVGRTLRQAGFEIAFAVRSEEVYEAAITQPTLIVTGTGGACAEALERLEVVFKANRVPKLTLDDDAWLHAGDTKAKLLFFADEASTRARTGDARRSERVLYETICAFRLAGLMEPAYGLSHNINRGGLYVRTLSPPTVDSELWVELRTVTGAPVHLRGRVIWRRDAGESSATSPSGFGLKIDAEQTPVLDLADWEAAYEGLLNAGSAAH
jgi:hypothetical protein